MSLADKIYPGIVDEKVTKEQIILVLLKKDVKEAIKELLDSTHKDDYGNEIIYVDDFKEKLGKELSE